MKNMPFVPGAMFYTYKVDCGQMFTEVNYTQYHPYARGEMADFDPLFLNTRHTFCSKSFLLQGSEKNMIPSLPSDPNHKILLIANGRFLTNRHTLLTEKQTCQLQSRRSPCRTTKPILSLSTTRSFMLPPLTGNIVLVQKYWMSILNKKIHLLFVQPTGGEKTLLYQTISAQLKGVFT